MSPYPPKTFKRATFIAAGGTVVFFFILMLFFTSGLKANPAFDPSKMEGMDKEGRTALMGELMIDMTGSEVLIHHLKNPALIAEQANMLLTVFALLFLSSVATSRLYIEPDKSSK